MLILNLKCDVFVNINKILKCNTVAFRACCECIDVINQLTFTYGVGFIELLLIR